MNVARISQVNADHDLIITRLWERHAAGEDVLADYLHLSTSLLGDVIDDIKLVNRLQIRSFVAGLINFAKTHFVEQHLPNGDAVFRAPVDAHVAALWMLLRVANHHEI